MEEIKNNVEIPAKFKNLVETVEKMNVMELAELVKVLEVKFGVSAAAPVAMSGGNSGTASNAAEEKSTFDVELKEAGVQKLRLLKLCENLLALVLKKPKI